MTILDGIAPCALFCYTCFGYQYGAVQETAKSLQALYRGWYERHAQTYGAAPAPEQQRELDEIRCFNKSLSALQHNAQCPGCRTTMGRFCGCIGGCVVPQCAKEHHVDFCAECPEFPCTRTDASFAPNVRKKWLEGNRHIQAHGVEAYFDRDKGLAHYCEFCDEKGATTNE